MKTEVRLWCMVVLACLFIFEVSASPIHLGEKDDGKAGFIQQLDQGAVVKIVALGTSLTGGKWPWVDVMMEWLNECYPDQVRMENLGVGASASMTVPAMEGNKYTWKRCGVDRVQEAMVMNPDVVFIEFAVNDAYQPYQISVEQSRKNLESMISSLQSANPNVEIILQTMNVVIDMPELNMAESSKRSKLPGYLKMYRKVAQENDLLLIDHYPNWKKFLKKEGRDAYIKVVTDGIHPNLEGYRKVVLPELKKVLQ
ncbi:MAG: SGNH/GDSL hydrolase family protein [Marinilabiliaceae bacterium]|nr:SGNH/GDSL hydrolase family protein [Marinilabiliaceae bacterium]